MARARSAGHPVVLHIMAVDRHLAGRRAASAPTETAARPSERRDRCAGVAWRRAQPAPARSGSFARALPQRDRGSAISIRRPSSTTGSCGDGLGDGGLGRLLAWFAGICGEADELYVSGSRVALARDRQWRSAGSRAMKPRVPSYSVDLVPSRASGGEPYPVLSANARQQLRRAFRHFEGTGRCIWARRRRSEEALSFFNSMKALHCASWERRGRAHSFCRRVLRAVPPAADRAQLCQRRDAAAQSLRRRPGHRLSL